jgi:hypothetical protein
VQASALCATVQLAGQYECVQSVSLSDEEVRVNMAYLASFRPRQAAQRDDAPRFAAGGDAIAEPGTSEIHLAQTCGSDLACRQDGARMRHR